MQGIFCIVNVNEVQARAEYAALFHTGLHRKGLRCLSIDVSFQGVVRQVVSKPTLKVALDTVLLSCAEGWCMRHNQTCPQCLQQQLERPPPLYLQQ